MDIKELDQKIKAMDDSSVFKLMLAKAVESKPLAFGNFDRTKNVQDQLQEMLNPGGDIQLDLYHLIAIADFWVGRDLKSMEQLWLAFVMSRKYYKRWSGNDWEYE